MQSVAEIIRQSELLRSIHKQEAEMPEQKDPQHKFQTNVPTTVMHMEFLSNGSNKYGPWFLYKGEIEGVVHTFFATEKLHGQLKEYPAGSSVVVNKKEEQGEQGTYVQWKVNPALFGPAGDAPPEPPKRDMGTLGETMAKCLAEAHAIVEAHNQFAADGLTQNREDVRSYAITMFIQANK